jgi:hypothetical protein
MIKFLEKIYFNLQCFAFLSGHALFIDDLDCSFDAGPFVDASADFTKCTLAEYLLNYEIIRDVSFAFQMILDKC